MDTRALQFESRFSFAPNSLHYCGRPSANQAFTDCLLTGQCNQVAEEVKHFIVLWPYLKTIGEATGLDPLSYKVIEAYWFGNSLLKKIKPEHYQLLLKNLKAQGVPQFLIDEIKTKIPKQFVPIHLFNILHVGVGRASNAVPFNLESINHCMIRWGKITTIDQEKHLATLKLNSLAQTKNSSLNPKPYTLYPKIETHPYHPQWFKTLHVGQTACVHWKLVCKVLTTREEANLTNWTATLINSL